MMRRSSMGVALFGALIGDAAQAGDNASVTVNAMVIGVCKFFTASPVINITNTGAGSNIDPSSATTATGNAAISYRCTNGTTPVLPCPRQRP